MKITGQKYFGWIILLFFLSCQKPYLPKVSSVNYQYLVVDGVINSGIDSTIIKLSRTVRLNQAAGHPESGAFVTIENEKNHKYFLTETTPGTYSVANLNLPTDSKYRLHIFTAANKEYVSDFVENKITPPIDSVGHRITKSGVEFYVDTHDAAAKTHYYRWEYDESWTYFTPMYSNLLYEDSQVLFRTPDQLVNFCYRHAVPANNIILGSSDKLSQDVIFQMPVGFVTAVSGKLKHVYSALIKQYAVTADAYKFWQLMKKNSEQLGSVFDNFPSSSIGNLHAVDNDPSDIVIGYISVSTVTSKRVFLQGRDLPFALPEYQGVDFPQTCDGGFIPLKPDYSLAYRLERTLGSGDSLLTIAQTDKNTGKITGYFYAVNKCVDCRLLGGTTVKPAYWP